MSNYKVVYNGLWQINILNVDINALERVGTDPKAFEKLWYENARNLGHEEFQRAMEDELRRQVERSLMPPVIISTGGRGSGRTHNQRVQLEQARLQSGEIDLLTYLDNISRDDI